MTIADVVRHVEVDAVRARFVRTGRKFQRRTERCKLAILFRRAKYDDDGHNNVAAYLEIGNIDADGGLALALRDLGASHDHIDLIEPEGVVLLASAVRDHILEPLIGAHDDASILELFWSGPWGVAPLHPISLAVARREVAFAMNFNERAVEAIEMLVNEYLHGRVTRKELLFFLQMEEEDGHDVEAFRERVLHTL